MGLSFSKQVPRARVRTVFLVEVRYADEDGVIQPEQTECRHFDELHAAHAYAARVVAASVAPGGLFAYSARVSTVYGDAR